jgi:hypothetical protein
LLIASIEGDYFHAQNQRLGFSCTEEVMCVLRRMNLNSSKILSSIVSENLKVGGIVFGIRFLLFKNR